MLSFVLFIIHSFNGKPQATASARDTVACGLPLNDVFCPNFRKKRAMRTMLFFAALGFLIAGLLCTESVADDPPSVAKRIGQYVTVDLTTDLDQLSQKQRQMIPLLIEAAKIMDQCFWYEAYGNRQELLDSIDDASVRRFAQINYGPWDRLDGNSSFVDGIGPKPEGANFYPAEMPKEEFEKADLSGKDSLYTFIRRGVDGTLKTVPYHQPPIHCEVVPQSILPV